MAVHSIPAMLNSTLAMGNDSMGKGLRAREETTLIRMKVRS